MYEQKAQAEMLKAMAVFNPQLVQCQKQWTAMAADTSQYQLRTTAPHAASVMQSQVVEFQHAAQHYLQSISVKLPLARFRPALSPFIPVPIPDLGMGICGYTFPHGVDRAVTACARWALRVHNRVT